MGDQFSFYCADGQGPASVLIAPGAVLAGAQEAGTAGGVNMNDGGSAPLAGWKP